MHLRPASKQSTTAVVKHFLYRAGRSSLHWKGTLHVGYCGLQTSSLKKRCVFTHCAANKCNVVHRRQRKVAQKYHTIL